MGWGDLSRGDAAAADDDDDDDDGDDDADDDGVPGQAPIQCAASTSSTQS